MKILHLRLENFRGVKNLDADFGGKNTDVFGANGTGKTTIANAITWLFCDAPATEEKDFTPKTAGAHDLRHRAEMEVEKDDGERYTFAKEFYEKWTKKRGSTSREFSGHVTDYYINGVPAKKKDYEATIQAATGATTEQMKMLLIHGYFPQTMKPDARRAVLFELGGDVTDAEVIAQNGLEALPGALLRPGTEDQYTVEEYKKMAAAERRKLNKELETIPARIDELSRSTADAEPRAIADIERDIEAATAAHAEALADVAAAKTPRGAEVKRAVLAGKRAELKAKRTAYEAETAKANAATYDAIGQAKRERDDHERAAVRAAEQAKHYREQIAELQQQREALLQEYAETQAEVWDPGKEICPTCGQPLPPGQIDELRAEFNQHKAEHKRAINAKGQACSKTVIEGLEAKAADQEVLASAEALKSQDAAATAAKLEEKLQTPPPFEETEEGKAILADIKQAEASGGDDIDTDALDVAEELERTRRAELERYQAEKAEAQAAERNRERIEELTAEQKQHAAELDRLEGNLALCDKFIRAKAQMITASINQHFKTVSWQLFKEQINGGLEQVCNPMTQNAAGEWVEYKSSNTASQVNAGLEIIDVLNKHFHTSLPVIVDRAESVCKLAKVNEQVIRLIVSAPDDTLRIKQREE